MPPSAQQLYEVNANRIRFRFGDQLLRGLVWGQRVSDKVRCHILRVYIRLDDGVVNGEKLGSNGPARLSQPEVRLVLMF